MIQAQAKKLKAERLLAKIERSMVPAGPDYDQETITDEERVMFRRVGLRMKAYLPLGMHVVLTLCDIIELRAEELTINCFDFQGFVVSLMVSLRICISIGSIGNL